MSVFAFVAPTFGQSHTQVGGQLGYDFDSSELFFGPNAVFETPIKLGDENLLLNPEFSYYLVDDVPGVSTSFWQLNVTALYPLKVEVADMYVGAGLGISHWSASYDSNYFLGKGSIVVPDYSDSSTDIGLNGKVGSTFGKGNVKPFAEFGFVISDSSWLYGQVGARYAL